MKYRVIERFREKYSITAMCKTFEVSRSGYYSWRNQQNKERKDQWLIDLITECQQRSKLTYGCRRIRHWIQRQTGKKVNLKAILRLMRGCQVFCVNEVKTFCHIFQIMAAFGCPKAIDF